MELPSGGAIEADFFGAIRQPDSALSLHGDTTSLPMLSEGLPPRALLMRQLGESWRRVCCSFEALRGSETQWGCSV